MKIPNGSMVAYAKVTNGLGHSFYYTQSPSEAEQGFNGVLTGLRYASTSGVGIIKMVDKTGSKFTYLSVKTMEEIELITFNQIGDETAIKADPILKAFDYRFE